MVCINKIDRPDARAEEVLDEVYGLFIDLDADDDQIEFPVFYACAKEGYAHTENKQEPGDLTCLFDAILEHIPAPKGEPEAVPQVLITQLGHDPYLGRLAIGRVVNGSIQRNKNMLAQEDQTRKIKVVQLSTFEGLERVPTESASVGEIIAIAGIAELEIGDTVTDLANPEPLPVQPWTNPPSESLSMPTPAPFPPWMAKRSPLEKSVSDWNTKPCTMSPFDWKKAALPMPSVSWVVVNSDGRAHGANAAGGLRTVCQQTRSPYR